MKKTILTTMLLLASATVSAQYYPDARNVDMVHIRQPRTQCRTEIRMPEVDGYKAIKADLHSHTVYSDGRMTMEGRMLEAWCDGLDVIAVTEHVEYRRYEKNAVRYYKGYCGTDAKASGYDIVHAKDAGPEVINVDFNVPVSVAKDLAKPLGLVVIPGLEVTRTPETIGHFNALFTKDNNTIHAADPAQSIRNAKAQGALIMHNHPGWLRPSLEMTDFEKKVYGEGLIDGVEVMNGAEFYPKAIDRAIKHNLFVTACTDIHFTTADTYGRFGAHRNMTIIFAKDNSLESLREALEAKRTLAYSYGVLAGREELLKKFVTACLDMEFIANDYKNRPLYKLTNNSSVEFCYRVNGSNLRSLPANSSVTVRLDKGKTTFDIEFTSAWCDSKKFLAFTVDPANWNKK